MLYSKCVTVASKAKEAIRSPETEVTDDCAPPQYVGAGKRSVVFCKNKKCSKSPSHFSNPEKCISK